MRERIEKVTVVTILRRFLVPSFVVTILYWLKFRAFVSPRAEVEYDPSLVIGKGTRIGSFTKIKTTYGFMKIGANTSIATGCFFGSHVGGLHIGDDCLISANVSIVASNYRFDDLDTPIYKQGHTSKGIKIGDNVWIGSNCSILDGAEIGDGSIISANSTVSGTIPANSVAQGSPASVIFTRR